MAVLPDVASLLNYRLEYTVILNEITQDNNKVQEDERNETVKFHRLKRSMEEAVAMYQGDYYIDFHFWFVVNSYLHNFHMLDIPFFTYTS